MTKEEKLRILEDAETRAYETLAEMTGRDMATEAMDHLMEGIASLSWERSRYSGESNWTPSPTAPEPDIDKGESAPKKPPVKLDPIEEPRTANAQPDPDEPVPPTKDEVRKKLAAYQTQANLDVQALMQSMGYAKLSQVPASRYWELLEKAQKTVDGEG